MNQKGDFTAELRLLWISLIAIGIGSLCAVVALVLQRLIYFFTNVFYYQELSFFHHPDLWERAQALGLRGILIPVLGGLIVGLMARYGSERIRGHGIPEALEAILIGRSRMSPKVAILKPLSSAISIGSGGPFGAEGPIIMTGGACGSLIAQVFQLTAAERKTLLVAGAAGGMTATFGTPVASVLLAVELLLFEWKPRSLFPVALACAMAMAVRPGLGLDAAPLFKVPLHDCAGDARPGIGCRCRRASRRLRLAAHALGLHLGGPVPSPTVPLDVVAGPRRSVDRHRRILSAARLGVGYDIIKDLLLGNFPVGILIPLILVKSFIWSSSLGSGTSGGVLAPLLIMGGALGR